MTAATFVQLDLFACTEAREFAQRKAAGKTRISDLVMGDIVQFRTYGGELVEGVYVTRGFWDWRDRESPIYYYFLVEGRYFEMNPKVCEWAHIGHDDTYVPPSRDIQHITSELADFLREFPLKKRTEALHSFQNRYPYLSFEYNGLIRTAWETASVQVSTMEEVLASEAEWTCKAGLNKELIQHIREVIFPLPPEERLSALFRLRWLENAWKDHHGQHRRICYFPERQLTYWKPLLAHLVQECDKPHQLVTLMKLWGNQSTLTLDQNLPQMWVED